MPDSQPDCLRSHLASRHYILRCESHFAIELSLRVSRTPHRIGNMAPLGVCFPTTSCCHNDALLFVFASLEKTPSSSCTKRATLDQLVFDDWSLRRSPWVTIIPMIIYTLLSSLTLYIELDNGIKLVESVLWDSVLRVLIIFPPPKIYGEM